MIRNYQTATYCLYYSVRNVIYFREPRDTASVKRLAKIIFSEASKAKGLRPAMDELKFRLTDFFLARLGLRVTEGTENEIPKGVWLSTAQRDFIAEVNRFGYGAKLG